MFLNERDITEEHFFAVMKKMMLTDDIKSYATKVHGGERGEGER